jgi:uridine kinase
MEAEQEIKMIRERIEQLLMEKPRVIVAIEGECTAGKTTLANELAGDYDATVFHMDDFLLRPGQRTTERLREPGGNVDYERFYREVGLPLAQGKTVTFRPYDCRSQTLKEPVEVDPVGLAIVEGTYSMHLLLEKIYDLSIFLSVEPEVQKRRILRRDDWLHNRFFEEWIPMEQKYFTETQAKQRCNVVIER